MNKTKNFLLILFAASTLAPLIGIGFYLPFMVVADWLDTPKLEFVGMCVGWITGITTFMSVIIGDH